MIEDLYTDQYWMQQAIEQAAFAALKGEIPVGAIIVSNNEVIGRGFNAPISLHDPSAHAEIIALRDACQRIQNYRLPDDAVLYVTLEPCTMCVGALVHSRVSRVVFGASEPKAGSLISTRQLFNTGYYNHVFPFEAGCMQAECSAQLSTFFKMRREQKRLLKLEQKQLQEKLANDADSIKNSI